MLSRQFTPNEHWNRPASQRPAAGTRRPSRAGAAEAGTPMTPRLRRTLCVLEAQFVATLLNLPVQDSRFKATGRRRID